MSDDAREREIGERHADFAARYSPGPDWEPFNQTHQDRGYLLARLAAERQRGERLSAAVAKVIEGFERGFFTRDTSKDDEPGWAIKLLPYLHALGLLANALAPAPERAE